MHYEVDMVLQMPFDDTARRFLTSVRRSANQVPRFRGGDSTTTITVEAHATDRDGAIRAAQSEIARIYPGTIHQPSGSRGPDNHPNG